MGATEKGRYINIGRERERVGERVGATFFNLSTRQIDERCKQYMPIQNSINIKSNRVFYWCNTYYVTQQYFIILNGEIMATVQQWVNITEWHPVDPFVGDLCKNTKHIHTLLATV